MGNLFRMVGLAALCGMATLSAGCMGLSLFSSDHTHYHGGAELRDKVENIETRLDALKNTTPVTKKSE